MSDHRPQPPRRQARPATPSGKRSARDDRDVRDNPAHQSSPPAAHKASGAGKRTPADRDPDAIYLSELGARLRHLRAIRGMSRSVLARTAGLSERYIAQIESGVGNASIIVLRRIAQATGTRLDDLVQDAAPVALEALIRDMIREASPGQLQQVRALLSDHGAALDSHRLPPLNARRIALIGLRGAGKSTLGRYAASQLGWEFVELNQAIEQENGFSMTDIFTLYGQDGYRRFERETLKRIAAHPGPMILATGGGIVAEPVTLEFLLSSFFTIWIKAQPEQHMARVRSQGDLRPMANDSDRSAMQELRAILASREPLYQRAAAIVDTSSRSVESAVAELARTIQTAPQYQPADQP